MNKTLFAAAAFAFAGVTGKAAATGIPTVDVAALAQNIIDMANQINQLDQALTQVQQGVQQIDEARRQVAEAQRAFDSLNGIRGLGSLLNSDLYNDARNYLPNDWQRTLELGGDISNGRYSSLAGIVEATRIAGRVYPDRSALNVPADDPALTLLDEEEAISNMARAETKIALDTGEQRLTELKSYKNTVNTLPDQKSTLDLQATMMAEGLLLQNEMIQVMNRKNRIDAETLHAETQKKERALRISHLPYDPAPANRTAREAMER